MEKLKMAQADIADNNIEQIGKLFPHVIIEAIDHNEVIAKAIDFDLLKQALSKNLADDDNERYRLDWPGKKAALLKANTPVNRTLRPCREESVNFDITENLYIEGDNFEVLKILQESYLSKIKMIYIDPPYNTGNDFIYKDKFAKNKDEYEEELGTKDDEGGKLFRNTDSNGRFHSDWLSMMYQRLLVARDLLNDDGVIFISIDDNEQSQLKLLCDEVFGQENFVAQLFWHKGYGKNDAIFFRNTGEYILCYSKCISNLQSIKTIKDGYYELKDYLKNKTYNSSDELQKYINDFYKNSNYEGITAYNKVDKNFKIYREVTLEKPADPQYFYDVIHPVTKLPVKIPKKGWNRPESSMKKLIANDEIIYGKDHTTLPRRKYYLDEMKYESPKTLIINKNSGGSEIKNIFDSVIFDYPKHSSLIKTIINFIKVQPNDIILDFFAGSGTTGDAVMQLNAEDGGKRKFIMVQLPEETAPDSESFKAGYKTIAEIGKERIRRAGKKILEELQTKSNQSELIESPVATNQLDIGFRVFKTDSSNMQDVFYHPSAIKQEQLSLLESNIKPDRTPEDLLTQVILDLGLTLNLPITSKVMFGNTLYIVQTNALVACFDDNIDFRVVDTIAKIKPFKVVFKDASFKDDKDRINVEERFKRLAPETKVCVI